MRPAARTWKIYGVVHPADHGGAGEWAAWAGLYPDGRLVNSTERPAPQDPGAHSRA